MEYQSIHLLWFGLVAGGLWVLNYWAVLKKPQIYVPRAYVVGGTPVFFKILLCLIGVLGWVLLSISLTKPRKALGYSDKKVKVNDIFFVVDVSKSMDAVDFSPDRIGAAKRKIKEFIDLRPVDRIGIIIFGSRVFTHLPLTQDLDLVRQSVAEIKTGSFIGPGTNIGDAIGLAVARLKLSLAFNKVVILLTDGVANVGRMTPLQAADVARQANVKVHAIGMGTDNPGKILPISKGPRSRMQSIPGGSYDLQTLKKIAGITGGRAFYAKEEDGLKKVLEKIDELEKTEILSQGVMLYKQEYYQFLLWGVLLLLFSEIGKRAFLREVE